MSTASLTNPKVIETKPLSTNDAKWISLFELTYVDAEGKQRRWESANRLTRAASTNVDAVTITPILLSPTGPAKTILVLQFRPPVNAICVELPAGLIDEGETSEQAALRELKEEVGFSGENVRVVDISPIMVSDPGLSNTNMQAVTVEISRDSDDEVLPDQELEESEDIERVLVPLNGLYTRLVEFINEGKAVDARLFHWASGIKLVAEQNKRYGLTT